MKKENKSNYFSKIYIGFTAKLILNILLFIISFVLLSIFILNTFSVQQEKRFNYTDKSNLDYKVYLKKNDFYENSYLGKDMIYVASLIDKVNVNFDYQFTSDIDLDVEFKYSIIGKLTIQDASGKSNYYEKTYTLLPEKVITLENYNRQKINEEISIDYAYYNKIANEFKINYGVDTLSNLTLYLTINKQSIDEKVNLDDFQTMSIEIPLSERSVNIEMNYKEINDTNSIISQTNTSFNKYICIFFILALSVVLSILTIRIVRLLSLLRNKKSKYDKYVERILVEYDRLIGETSSQPILEEFKVIKIDKFQELVDIRDNLRLPIMYYSIVKHQKCWFYIIHNNEMYLHVVKAIDLEDKK